MRRLLDPAGAERLADASTRTRSTMTKPTTIQALVYAMRWEAEGTMGVELRPLAPETQFPAFDAGSHVDLHLGPGLVRSYSLCNAPGERGRYMLAVHLDRHSRGGSRAVHEVLRVGQQIAISAPRNNFRLVEDAPRSVLVAGGIGITPIWSMLQRLVAIGRPTELIYCARSRREAAFVAQIEALTAGLATVRWHFDDEHGDVPDLAAMLRDESPEGHFYCCGPAPMLQAFESACRQHGYPCWHVERFTAAPAEPTATTTGCTVSLRKSGLELSVGPDESILEAVLAAGVPAAHSCTQGICGACETAVVEGEIEHRDSVLTERERNSGRTMMICVSRCTGDRLVLDL